MALENFSARGREIEPIRAINLRKRCGPPRARRPFDAELIANEECRIPVIFHGPDVNKLAAALPQRAERKCLAVGTQSGLFFEFPERRRVWIFAALNFTFWNGPGAIVLVPPIGTAWMCKKNFEVLLAAI